MGQLVFQATAGGQVALVGPNPATNFSINVPAITGTLVTTGDTGTVTNTMLASNVYTAPGTIGSVTPNTGAFTTLSASSTVSGTGFSNYLASPPAIGGTAPSTGKFTTITGTLDASISGLTVGKGGGAVAYNTAVGVVALASGSLSGNFNTGVGWASLNVNTTGTANTSLGANTLTANTTGGSNTAVGYQSLVNNTTASYNTAVGYQAGYSNTTGTRNVSVGDVSLYTNSTGSYSVGIGHGALYANTTGTNVAIGDSVLSTNTTGTNNVGIGSYDGSVLSALFNNTTGSYNIAVGNGALKSNTTASNNTAVGYQALYAGTTSPNNTCIGYVAGNSISTSGSGGNTCIGTNSGINLTTGNNNIYIGASPTASSGSVSTEIVIGTNGQVGKGTNTGFISPNSGGVYQGNNSAAWSITSDQRLKKNIVDNTTGLNAISQIQVRNFEYRTKDEVTELPVSSAIDIKGIQLGAIAQEIQVILPDCVKTESTGVMSVDTTNLTWYLINAVKELKAEIDLLKGK